MNKSVTSKDKIIKTCKKIVVKEGLGGINIRKVAAECNTAVGSIYYYFPSKTALVTATIEDIWFEIFHASGKNFNESNFIEYIEAVFKSVQEGCSKYPNFFTLHSVSFASKDKEQGRMTMDRYFTHMKENLVAIMNNDPLVNKEAFNENMTMEDFADMIFSVLVSMMVQKNYNTAPLCELIRKTVY